MTREECPACADRRKIERLEFFLRVERSTVVNLLRDTQNLRHAERTLFWLLVFSGAVDVTLVIVVLLLALG